MHIPSAHDASRLIGRYRLHSWRLDGPHAVGDEACRDTDGYGTYTGPDSTIRPPARPSVGGRSFGERDRIYGTRIGDGGFSATDCRSNY